MGSGILSYAQNNVIDEIIWVVGDEAILKSDVEKVRLGMLSRGERIEGDPYCLIPEQLAVQKLFLDQAKIDSIEVPASAVNSQLSRYENNVIANLGSKEKAEELSAMNTSLIEEIAHHLSSIKTNVEEMVEARKVANKIESEREKAILYHDTVLPYFNSIRYNVDKLELIVDDEMWSLPKYRELLFIR